MTNHLCTFVQECMYVHTHMNILMCEHIYIQTCTYIHTYRQYSPTFQCLLGSLLAKLIPIAKLYSKYYQYMDLIAFLFMYFVFLLIQFNSIQFNSLFQTRVHTHVHNNIIQNKIQCLLAIKY